MTEQLAHYLIDFALDRISFGEFQDWFIDYSMGAGVDPEDQPVVDFVEGAMAEFTGRYISEGEFRGAIRSQLENLTIRSSLASVPASRSSSAGRTVQVELRVAT